MRKPTFFEKTLLLIGLIVGVAGFKIINTLYQIEGALNAKVMEVSFLWLILFILIILAAIGEDIKEEVSIILKEQSEETRLLRKIAGYQLDEEKKIEKVIKGIRK